MTHLLELLQISVMATVVGSTAYNLHLTSSILYLYLLILFSGSGLLLKPQSSPNSYTGQPGCMGELLLQVQI